MEYLAQWVRVTNCDDLQHWIHDTDWFIVTCGELLAMTVSGKILVWSCQLLFDVQKY
jgi:hypothetical protein